jgi:hypothetical protein
MRRLFILAVPLSLAVLAFGQQPTVPQSLPSKKEAVDLLEKAEEQTRLTVPRRSPFHLAAKLHYTSAANSSDGTYDVLWAAPGRFREEFRLGPISETDVALDDKLYILRNNISFTYPQWKVRMLTGLPDRNEVAPAPIHVAKIYASGGAGGNLACFVLGEPMKGRTECLDSVAGQLVSVDQSAKHGKFTIGLIQDRFISLGPVNYPGHMLSTMGDESLEVSVEKLEPVTRFADEALVPPDGASSRDWCAKPEVTKQLDPSTYARLLVGSLLPQKPKGFRTYYLQVASDGRIEMVTEMYSDGTVKRADKGDLVHERFPIHSCGGRPIESETFFGGFPIP